MYNSKTVCSPHLDNVLSSRRKKTIKKCIDILSKYVDKFDAIAICGYSQCLISPCIADMLKKSLIIVRKSDENRTSLRNVEGSLFDNYVIIDDLIDSGHTINHIMSTIKNYHNQHANCVGIYLYDISNSTTKTNKDCLKLFGIPLLTS